MNRIHYGVTDSIAQAFTLLTKKSMECEPGDCISIDISVHFNILNLKSKSEFPLLYWKSRDENQEYFCWGVTKTYKNLPTILNKEIPIFAGFAFDESMPQWPGFSGDLCWQPKYFVRQNQNSTKMFHIVSKTIKFTSPKGTLPVEEHHIPNKKTWIKQIKELKNCFKQEALSKIVLSRQSCINVADIWHLFTQLTSQQPQCYHFLFSPKPGHVFVGCSPERLFSISENNLYTEAVAGTRPRGFASNEDLELDTELRNSNKDNAEHNIVTDYIVTTLKQFSDSIKIHPQQVLRLKHVQHLQTPISSVLKKDISVEQILHKLHPTPAVCGFPKKLSQQKIRQIEEFSRGWYGGTIGILTKERIDFTVAIRSALNIENKLFIWTGAGIVSDSNPAAEWYEINSKGKQFFDLVD
jgi:menaquinone-specific isochorismate synthase